ncbi:DUF3800 domain-containing protein [Streptomyces sp. 5-6(2022)]|uniref:DUF3800 domain-containing protein n=1 Tax=Streptomyces sp. 5-6(2022) TaxID=2936510 RepID=UPI0023B94ECD|nr:DUF3800 domain-containing protein [Streptomyces sp. 5-6(2022)]
MAVPQGSGVGHSCFCIVGSLLYLCYLDESGTGQVLNPAVPDSVPVMAIGGFTVPESQVKALAWDFIALKKRFRPELRKLPTLSQVVHHEIKGETIRKSFRRTGRNQRRMAHGFLDHLLNILEQRDCTVMARIWVKQDGAVNDDAAMYASAVTALCANFEHYLAERSSSGIAVLDSRNPSDNIGNVHCVTTRKFGKGGDRMPHLPESPVFGHSNTHLGLQIADLIVSAILAPAAAVTYAGDLTGNVHCHPGFNEVRDRHCPRLGKLQHRYQSPTGKWTGGIVVSDARGHRSAGKLFTPAVATTPLGLPSQKSADDLATAAAFPRSTTPAP